MGNRKKFKDKMKKRCPDCGGVLDMFEDDNKERVSYSKITIECPNCGYCKEIRKKNNQRIESPEW